MSGTYQDSLPSDRDRARATLGDTSASDWLHTDDHINAVLTWKGSLDAAVAFLAGELIARFAQEPVRKTAQGESLDYSDRLKSWQAIVAKAEAAASVTSGVGGIQMVAATYGGANSTADEFSREP